MMESRDWRLRALSQVPSSGQRKVIKALATLAEDDGMCDRRVAEIAKRAGLRDRQTRTHLRALAAAGWLSVLSTERAGTVRVYWLTEPAPAVSNLIAWDRDLLAEDRIEAAMVPAVSRQSTPAIHRQSERESGLAVPTRSTSTPAPRVNPISKAHPQSAVRTREDTSMLVPSGGGDVGGVAASDALAASLWGVTVEQVQKARGNYVFEQGRSAEAEATGLYF